MNIIRVIKGINKLIIDKDYRFLWLAGKGVYNKMPDEEYLKRKFKAKVGKELNLSDPKTMNEKLQWLKLYDRKPEYVERVDKYQVRNYITSILGEKYLIPLIGVWETPDEIDFDMLPNKFVLKCNHNSGLGMCICKDKSKLDIKKVKKELKKGLEQDYYLTSREWPYKDVPRKIIAEKYMTDSEDSDNFTDYKFYCYNGVADCVMVCLDRNTGDTKFYFFDKEWNLKRYNKRGRLAPENFTLPKPKHIDEMFKIAEKLSKGYPYVRIDLYATEEQVYFGEITLFPDSGFDPNRLPEIDRLFGDKIDLSIAKGK